MKILRDVRLRRPICCRSGPPSRGIRACVGHGGQYGDIQSTGCGPFYFKPFW